MATVIPQFPSAASKLTGYILICSLVLSVLFSAVQIRIDYLIEKERFQTNLDTLLVYQSDQLALALQQYHNTAVQLIFEGLMLNRSIVSVYVDDDLSGYSQRRGLSADDLKNDLLQPYLLEKTVDLFGNNLVEAHFEKIGSLTVWIDKREIHTEFRERAAMTMALEVVRNLLLVLALVVIFYQRLTRPLGELIRQLQGIVPGCTEQPPVTCQERLCELQALTGKINYLLTSTAAELRRCQQEEQNARQEQQVLEHEMQACNRALKNSKSQLQQRFDELERTQRLLSHSQQMASLGYLVAAITEESNQPLAESEQQVKQWLASDGRDHPPGQLVRLRTNLEQVHRRINELHVLASPEPRQSLDLAALMQKVVAEQSLNERINLVIETTPIPGIECVESQVRLAFRQLLANAREALGSEPGKITIRLETVNDTVCVSIRDTGEGMDATAVNSWIHADWGVPENGLGLAEVAIVMAYHSGDLTIDSELGVGTQVLLTFPVATLSSSASSAAS
ncbi:MULTISPECIES: sensor histidine kinase [unclassified Oceanobacter]|uniref:sensor histidine kinase n=2 Tax=Gammaproteobacteria TaxID=1236 RepID=UPI002733960B|nr:MULTISPECIES: HAMP domain-containing sensor histidine kinase [unclassified Oceanobacter]MDP2608119.1 HAMP domain-containing sensor histidine kinase [Oceanobacter sp. 1_MG-2023]MDP2611219.1 HAMP domain-containing sensor histidine kinase [Oceanobacter sp. 2_MG-2023]